jgi:hypothetical protein
MLLFFFLFLLSSMMRFQNGLKIYFMRRSVDYYAFCWELNNPADKDRRWTNSNSILNWNLWGLLRTCSSQMNKNSSTAVRNDNDKNSTTQISNKLK